MSETLGQYWWLVLVAIVVILLIIWALSRGGSEAGEPTSSDMAEPKPRAKTPEAVTQKSVDSDLAASAAMSGTTAGAAGAALGMSAAEKSAKARAAAESEAESATVEAETQPAPEPAPKPAPKPQPAPAPKPQPTAAPAAAAKPNIAAAVGDADNLQLLKGVGPKLNTLLGNLGVTRFDQIAAWTDTDIAEVDQHLGTFKGRIVRDNWIDQAGYLAKGDKAGFEAKYGALGGEL